MKRLGVFGSTGSIGTHTLALARQFKDQFKVVALTAGKNIALLREQISEFKPQVVVTSEAGDAALLGHEFKGIEFLHGKEGLVQCAGWQGMDIACQGILGFAALAPTLELIRTSKTVALANKETLVVAGDLIQQMLINSGSSCIPVDSEHNALYQLLKGKEKKEIESLVLTASGGPLWGQPNLALDEVTPAIATRHPSWKMGPKISVDSATLMNKGLEIVEAHFLFGVPAENIEVWVHPQSIVHGAVWLVDGTCQAQLSKPDMRASISYALGFPDRLIAAVPKLSLSEFARLEFFEADALRFPLLELPRKALKRGPSFLVVLNAANEIAVESFLQGRIRFSAIASVLEEVLEAHPGSRVCGLEAIEALDEQARAKTLEKIKSLNNS